MASEHLVTHSLLGASRRIQKIKIAGVCGICNFFLQLRLSTSLLPHLNQAAPLQTHQRAALPVHWVLPFLTGTIFSHLSTGGCPFKYPSRFVSIYQIYCTLTVASVRSPGIHCFNLCD